MTRDLTQLAERLQAFNGVDLTASLSQIEGAVHGITAINCLDFLVKSRATTEALSAAAEMKRLAGQINVVIHALGILLCLPHILEAGEQVDYVSLGAGNTGRAFDLETNYRVAEFKFIKWRGGPESIRQNGIFKDFFLLAHSESKKRKYLYVLGSEQPLKFFNGGRALNSVLSKDNKIRNLFYGKHGEQFSRVSDYYQHHKHMVSIVDMSDWLPQLDVQISSDAEDHEL
jgi:hypothetical protein